MIDDLLLEDMKTALARHTRHKLTDAGSDRASCLESNTLPATLTAG
jgi:hypothetical protein